jgi:hypothetical protein
VEVEVAPLEQQSRDPARPAGGTTGWPQWIAWLGAAFAVLSNVIGVAEVATANRLVLSLAAGALAVVVGGFWLWRLFAQGESSRAGMVIFALNLAMVVIGAGVLGGAGAHGSGWPPPWPPVGLPDGGLFQEWNGFFC